MILIYERARGECKYTPTRFLQLVAQHGGVAAARHLLASEAPQYGFTELWECGRLDLTVEAHVLKPEFAELFTDAERAIARERLEEYGYQGGSAG